MPRVKKTRKIGTIGVAKTQTNSRGNAPKKASKAKKGKKAGTRNNFETTSGQASNAKGKQIVDSRHGSKKPVQLVKSADKPKFKHPKDELKFIEADAKLDKLLNLIDSGQNITALEQEYVDSKLSRHAELCDLLGIDNEDHEEASDKSEDNLDLLEKLERGGEYL